VTATVADTGDCVALSLELCALDPERVEAACHELGALAITYSDSRDDAVLEPAPGELRLWPATRLQALFPAATDAAALAARLSQALGLDAARVEARHLGARRWEREWLRDFHALRFGRRLWVCPRHEQVREAEAVVVALDPGLAFGTGTHASTALCLEWLDGQLQPGLRVIDYGCGSGILGIAAARLGATRVQSYDIDPQALLATAENAAANAVSDRLAVCARHAELEAGTDLLLANILAGTLRELAAEFATLVRPGGRILLAGILADQAETVADAYAPWFDIAPSGQRDGWVALAGARMSDVHGLS
jgi:ribosomal protein L11 methyltransferase